MKPQSSFSGSFFLPLLATLCVLTRLTVAASDIALTNDNFDDKTKGLTAFIKWYAPWCGHCQELAPKWEKLAKDWEHKEGVIIASVDCTGTQEEEWCVSLGITGFPTLLYGDPSQGGVFLQPYSGDKSYEALSEFASETLNKPVCSPGNPSLCEEAERAKINDMWNLTPEELQASILEKEKLIEKEESDFKQAFDEMQASYDKQSQEHEFRLAKMKSKVRLMKSFLDKKKKPN